MNTFPSKRNLPIVFHQRDMIVILMHILTSAGFCETFFGFVNVLYYLCIKKTHKQTFPWLPSIHPQQFSLFFCRPCIANPWRSFLCLFLHFLPSRPILNWSDFCPFSTETVLAISPMVFFMAFWCHLILLCFSAVFEMGWLLSSSRNVFHFSP